MPKHDFRTTTMIAYDTAMRRAQGAIRRGHKQDAAYWLKAADHAHRIDFRAISTRETHAGNMDSIRDSALRGDLP